MNVKIEGVINSGVKFCESIVIPDTIGVGPNVIEHLESEMKNGNFFILADETGILGIDFDQLAIVKVVQIQNKHIDEPLAPKAMLIEE